MRDKTQLLAALNDAEENLQDDSKYTAKSFRLESVIRTYFGDKHEFLGFYNNCRAVDTDTPYRRLIEFIRSHVETNGYDWWDYHAKQSSVEKFFEDNPKTYELLKSSMKYVLPLLSAVVIAVISIFKDIWYGIFTLFLIIASILVYRFLQRA